MRLLSLLCIATAVVAHSHDHDDHDHVHDENSNVVTLTDSTFKDHIKNTPLSLIEFYAPWCGHCKRLAPEFEQAANELVGVANLAKVDCTTEKDTCSQYGIQGYPTLKVFRNDGSEPASYEQARKADAIVKFLKKQTQSAFDTITTADALKDFKEKDQVTVAFFGPSEGKSFDIFSKVANALRNEREFAVVSPDLAAAEDVKAPALVVYKKFDENRVVFDGNFEVSDLTKFISSEAFPLLGEIGPENFQSYMDRGHPLVWHFLESGHEVTKGIEDAAAKVAGFFKGKLSFVKLDGVKWEQHAKTFGLTKTPGIVVQDFEKKKNYVFPQEEHPTFESLKKHVQDFVDGKLIAHLKSEPVPEKNDGNVFTLVGKNFEEVVNDKNKDVFVEFYAPWCGHCKSLTPKFEALGEEFKGHKSIVIAKIDATENDTPADISGFPTLIYYPADKKEGITYDGDRVTSAMADFVREHSATLKHKKHDEL